MFSVQEALDIVRNNQYANGPRYEQAWKVLEAAVLATAQNRDYAAALRVHQQWCAYVKSDTYNDEPFDEWCQRLNASTHCA